MGEILILERLVNRIVKSCASGLVLCGKRDCMRLGDRDHDLLFHIMSNVPYKTLKDDNFFFVPVISGNPFEEIYKIHMQSPYFGTYAMRDDKPKICESGGKKEFVEGAHLKFFDVQRGSMGLIVDSRKDYFTASERDFKENFENYSDILSLFKRFRTQLKSKYGC